MRHVHPLICGLIVVAAFSGCALNPVQPGFSSLDSVTCIATESHLETAKDKTKKSISERVALKHQLSVSSVPVEGDYLVGISKKQLVRYLVGVENRRLNLGLRHHKEDAAVARSFPDVQDLMSLSLEHPANSGDVYSIDCRMRPATPSPAPTPTPSNK